MLTVLIYEQSRKNKIYIIYYKWTSKINSQYFSDWFLIWRGTKRRKYKNRIPNWHKINKQRRRSWAKRNKSKWIGIYFKQWISILSSIQSSKHSKQSTTNSHKLRNSRSASYYRTIRRIAGKFINLRFSNK